LKYINHISKTLTTEPTIISRVKYLNSAVLIPIVILNDVEYLLFQKRSQNVRQPGEVSFPGGHFDKVEDINFQSTAVRETCEELGIDESKIIVLGKLGTLVAPMGVIVEAYVGELNINSLSELNIDKREVDKIFIIPIDFFIKNNPSEYITRLELHPTIKDENGDTKELFSVKDLGLPERYALPWTGGKHRILVYNNTEEVIWGITAELVYELSNKLKEKIDK
jgi:8-oxo-dGTP pyrophosphatase MutT (NUDIX family)